MLWLLSLRASRAHARRPDLGGITGGLWIESEFHSSYDGSFWVEWVRVMSKLETNQVRFMSWTMSRSTAHLHIEEKNEGRMMNWMLALEYASQMVSKLEIYMYIRTIIVWNCHSRERINGEYDGNFVVKPFTDVIDVSPKLQHKHNNYANYIAIYVVVKENMQCELQICFQS